MAENTELMTVDNIFNRVYVIRGQQVMLDYDLAEIYGYEVKVLNQQVKRNIDRFPEDFMFQLTKDEIPADFLKSHFATLNENGNKRGLHIKKLPYTFTEQGIYMFATVLRGELAEQQSIFIMRTFLRCVIIYEAIQPEMDVIRAIVDARTSQNMTQKELAERTGINQADISKLLFSLSCSRLILSTHMHRFLESSAFRSSESHQPTVQPEYRMKNSGRWSATSSGRIYHYFLLHFYRIKL